LLNCMDNPLIFDFGNDITKWEMYHKLKTECEYTLILIDKAYININVDVRYTIKKQLMEHVKITINGILN